AATILYRVLQRADALVKGGERDPKKVQEELEALIAEEPLATVEYVALVSPDTLEPVSTLAKVTLVALAVRIGKTRLIDNALVAPDGIATTKNRAPRQETPHPSP